MKNLSKLLLALGASCVAQTQSWAIPIELFRPPLLTERYFEPDTGGFVTRNDGFEITVSNEGYEIQTPDGPLTMTLLGAQTAGQAEGMEPAVAVTHYALGSRPSAWRYNVPRYSRVRIPGVYRGIDIVYHHDRGGLEFDLHVAPGTDPNAIVMQFEGADKIELSQEGDLLLHRDDTVVWQKKPTIYQNQASSRLIIAGRYSIENNRARFVIGDYDRSAPLVIDPEISFSSIVGRNQDLGPLLVGTDLLGNVYLAGTVYFPYTTHPVFQYITSDLFVTKLDPNGNEVYTLFFGGNARDILHGFHVDGAGNLSLAGETSSTDFPTLNAPQPRRAINDFISDGFVTRMTPNGGFVFSTYLGGSGTDSARAVAADSMGNVFVTGTTVSRDFPVTEGVLKSMPDSIDRFFPHGDAFVTKLRADGGSLLYSTFLGGEETVCLDTPARCLPAEAKEEGLAIAVDAAGNAFIAGITNSLDFPVTPGAFQPECACDYFSGDAFVAKLNSNGSALLYSTYLGGIDTANGNLGRPEAVGGLAVDLLGNAYVVGATPNFNFQVTPGALHPDFEITTPDPFRNTAFVTKVNAAGTDLIYSTFLSGKDRERASAVSVDAAGRAYVVGSTNVPEFPVSASGFPRGSDFLAILNPAGSSLEFSSLLPSGFQATDVLAGADGGALLAGASGYAYRVAKTTAGDFELPAILGTANAAGLQLNGRASPGSLITIFGHGIGPDEPAGAKLDENGKISTTLAGMEVLFERGGRSPITYAQSDQVNVVVPFSLQPGEPRTLTIRKNGVDIASTQVHAVAADPAIFRILDPDPSGVQPAAALNQDGTLNSAQNPAKPGTIVAVFGTGFGPLDGSLADGEIPFDNLPRVRLPVSLIFNSRFGPLRDVAFPIHYAGQAPGLVAGVMQLNFEIPANAFFPSNVVFLDLMVGDQSHSFTVYIGR